jgi:hypothetical protein
MCLCNPQKLLKFLNSWLKQVHRNASVGYRTLMVEILMLLKREYEVFIRISSIISQNFIYFLLYLVNNYAVVLKVKEVSGKP